MDANWQDAFTRGSELILATCSNDCAPNANVVASVGIVDDFLLICDNQMNQTIDNLLANGRVCIISKKENYYIRIKGSAKVEQSGKYFEICREADENYTPKNAVLISIDEIFDLNSLEVIK